MGEILMRFGLCLGEESVRAEGLELGDEACGDSCDTLCSFGEDIPLLC